MRVSTGQEQPDTLGSYPENVPFSPSLPVDILFFHSAVARPGCVDSNGSGLILPLDILALLFCVADPDSPKIAIDLRK